MQRSSTKIGALATALAKAQSELANPEKSLIATLPPPVSGGAEKSFRYASLASGLDLVRKCLGQHEIATVQATSIDRDSGLIRLTTTLVHASGEWMASDWPVCPITETAAPHRMGAALTYARRYGLFTLVGIAGEDDLDAPDLPLNGLAQGDDGREGNAGTAGPLPNAPTSGGPPGALAPASPQGRKAVGKSKAAVLPAESSARLRDQLLLELAKMDEISALTAWAHRTLPRKNELSNPDAMALEKAFTERLTKLTAPLSDDRLKDAQSQARPVERNGHEQVSGPAANEVMVLSKPARDRDRIHLKFVARQPCLLCGRMPSDPHHIKFAESWMAGRKVSDRFTVPLCRLHHHELHRRGNERVWWEEKGIDPLSIAKALWDKTHAPTSDEIIGHAGDAVNGKSVADHPSLAGPPQNDETKPIAGSEAR
jgi:ERF superfamily protein